MMLIGEMLGLGTIVLLALAPQECRRALREADCYGQPKKSAKKLS